MPDVLETLKAALVHHQRGEWAPAEALYRQVLATEPEQPDALHLLGFMTHQRGDSARALEPMQKAIALAPGVAFQHANLGLVQRALGQLDAAHASLLQAHRLDPAAADTCNTLGAVCAESGRHEEAVGWYQKALDLRPDHVGAQVNLGHAWAALRRPDQALACFEAARGAQPDHPGVHFMVGTALSQLGRHDEAVVAFRQALAQRPDDALALSHLAKTLTRVGAADAAIVAARQALALQPALADAWSHLGTPLQHQGAVIEAEAAFRKSLAIDAHRPYDRFNLALNLLLQGDFEAGWSAYECRLDLPSYPRLGPAPRCPVWRGEALAGRSLLVMAEQGLGDLIQFVRYVPLLRERGATVVLQGQPGLLRLMQTLRGVAHCVDVEQTPPETDYAVPVMSLPQRFGTTLASIPAAVPYLHATLPDTLKWRRRLAGLQDGPRVGLVWQGRATHGADRYRSLPLSALDPLTELDGVHFISLQRDPPPEAPGAMAQRLTDLAAEQTDMADLAGLLANIDLVISVDTAVCHLAGAMARPVWVLLQAGPDFRWLTGRDDSPWYPSARLFRQTRLGDWTGVVERVRKALHDSCRGQPLAC
jgi:tetratricopeptide (TPR) repeat protein